MKLSIKQAAFMLIAFGLNSAVLAQATPSSSGGQGQPMGPGSPSTNPSAGTGADTDKTGAGTMGNRGTMKGTMPKETTATSGSNFDTSTSGSNRTNWIKTRTLGAKNIEDIKEVQQALNERGYNVGKVDGVIGLKTQAAISSFQSANGMTASGSLDNETLAALGLGHVRKVASPASSNRSVTPTNETRGQVRDETSADDVLNESGASDLTDWE